MKKTLTLLVSIAYIAMMSNLVVSCSHEENVLSHDRSHHDHDDHDHHDHDDHDDHEHDHNGHNSHNHSGLEHGDEIILEPEKAKKMGVRTSVIEPTEFSEAILTTGRIEAANSSRGIATSSTSGIFTFAPGISTGTSVTKGTKIGTINNKNISGGDTNAAALANLNNAKRELDRLTPLYEKQLITAERFNSALAAYEIAKAAYSPAAASGIVTAPTSGVITETLVNEGQFVDIGTEIAVITNGDNLILTADLPMRYASFGHTITSAKIVAENRIIDLSDFGATRKSNINANSNITDGYIPIVFSFKGLDTQLLPGYTAEVYLIGNTRENVIAVPLTAISEQQGNYFIYKNIDDEGYIKSQVTLGNRDGQKVEILSGITSGDVIVTEGVTALRLAETSGNIPEGHSHSH